METLPRTLAWLMESTGHRGFSSQKANNAELWFPLLLVEQAVEQTVV